MDGQACKVEQAETVYYPVQYYRKSIQEKLLDIIHIKDYRRDECAWAYYINNFKTPNNGPLSEVKIILKNKINEK